MKKKVVGLGEILWDVFPEGKKLGGAPANFAYHASQIGLDGYIVSAIGKDDLGEEIISELSTKGMNLRIESVDYPTGTVMVQIDEKGIPEYEICENVAWDNIPFTSQVKQLAEDCDAVCFGTLAQRSEVSRNTVSQFLDSLPQRAMKIFDINLRQHYYSKELIENSLRRCNMLKINDDEVKVVSDIFKLKHQSESEFCQYMLSRYELQYVVLTKGENGSYAMDRNQISFMDSPKVIVADTVGAGDAFTAAFVYGILSGYNLTETHRMSVDLSAFVCTHSGAMPIHPGL